MMGDEKLENYFRTLGELAKKDHKIRVILRKVTVGTEVSSDPRYVTPYKYHHKLTNPNSNNMYRIMNELSARTKEHNLV